MPVGPRLRATALVLVLGVAAIYGGTYRHQYLNYDDDVYITNNPEVMRGLSVRGLLWAFGYHAGNWHPLTWLSHMLDAQLFGAWSGGTHLVSAGFHAVSAVLLLRFLVAATGAFWRSAAVAALFAMHPLRVESVAWASERKDVLSAVFWMLTLTAYLRYTRRPGVGRYLLALGLFALGLTAKPMLVTLPFVLVLLDWWPLGRTGAGVGGLRSRSRLLAEKAPLLLLSLASGALTFAAQTAGIRPMVETDVAMRLANGALSYVLYCKSFLWPSRLAVLYPFPRNGMPWAIVAAAITLLVLVSAAAFLLRRRHPYLLVGWLWYLGTMLPVIGIIQVGAQARNDRYTYLTMIGITVALVWFVDAVWPRRSRLRAALGAAVGVWIVVLMVTAGGYVRLWRDNITLFEHAVRVTRDNYVILNNLGAALCTAGRYEEALVVLSKALSANPDFCNSYSWQGNSFLRLRRLQEAVPAYSRALSCYERQQSSPGEIATAYGNLGMAYLQLGLWADAERMYRALLQIWPEDSLGRTNLAIALHEQARH
jgi:tetratricopeptide (TPR) repeat protein